MVVSRLTMMSETDKQAAMAALGGNGGAVVVEGFKMKLTQIDLQYLLPLTWLNDNVINFYFELISERARRDLQATNKPDCAKLKIHVLTSFFNEKLQRERSHSGVKNWSNKSNIKVLDMDKVFIPINIHQSHWCLAVINFQKHQFEYYDSLGGRPSQWLFKCLRDYVLQEANLWGRAAGPASGFNLEGWHNVIVNNIPLQQNGSDCGVYVCTYGDLLSENMPLSFSQEHIDAIRLRMVRDILRKRLD